MRPLMGGALHRRQWLAQSLVLSLLSTGLSSAQASDKTALRLVVGFAPGGNVDWVARVLGEKLRPLLGRIVIVDNKPGAGGRIGLNEVRRAAPNGNTLTVTVDAPLTMYPWTVAKLEYDPVKDFTPIARVASFDYAFAVAGGHPAQTIKAFAEWARQNPKEASYASPGLGSGPSFVAQEIAKNFKVTLTDVPYRGGAAANGDVIGGTIAATSGVLPDIIEFHRSGKLRILAVGSAKRSPLLPDVPTLRESGVAFEGAISVSVYGPPALPASLVAVLLKAIQDVLDDAGTRAQFAKQGLTVAPLPPEQLAIAQATDTRLWQGIIKASGYLPQ